MKSDLGSANRRTKGVLAVLVCVAVLLLMAGVPATASAHPTSGSLGAPARSSAGPGSTVVPTNGGSHTYLVKPNGVNDTANLQAAFNSCTSHNWVCTIQLVKGTYYTDQIYAIGFQGSFVGAGQGATIIQGLANLQSPGAAYNTSTNPFWAAAPGPANPWPDLFTFVNGNFRVSQMTLVDTYFNPVPNGWNYAGYDLTYLWADILVTGEQANAAFDHFALVTGAGEFNIGVGTPSSFDSSGGLVFEGMLLPASWQSQGYPSAFTNQIPVSGTFSVTNCFLNGTDSAVWAQNTLDASVTIGFNSLTSSPSMIALADLSNTQVWVYANQMTNVMYAAGVIAEQSVFKYNLLPSTIYVTGNYIESNWYGSGVWAQDFGPSEGLASTLSVVATGNAFVFDNSCGCANLLYAGALGAVDTVSAVLSGNTIFQGGWGVYVSGGPATVRGNLILGTYAGVFLYAANYTHVTGNLVKNSGFWGIWVGGGSSYNTVAWNYVAGSGLYDLYWDQTGTGDLWYGNVFGTSSPAVLP